MTVRPCACAVSRRSLSCVSAACYLARESEARRNVSRAWAEVQALQTTASRYGLTPEQVRVVRAVDACMICASAVSGFKSDTFAVDHCHGSGVVRGPLTELTREFLQVRRLLH
ncbi:endonuclease domain-containing protein [Streptomyces sp. NPDC058375]|uniref:endonuclease domain-containing protein n=1 Tax=Streptomyces sp. NPDC058375 TaxID=3346467 RepID=UPI003647987E